MEKQVRLSPAPSEGGERLWTPGRMRALGTRNREHTLLPGTHALQ